MDAAAWGRVETWFRDMGWRVETSGGGTLYITNRDAFYEYKIVIARKEDKNPYTTIEVRDDTDWITGIDFQRPVMQGVMTVLVMEGFVA